MDKLSEYIPLIIILLSVVISIIGKKKKPGNITQETTLPGIPAGEFMEEIELPPILAGSYPKIADEKPKKQVFHQPETKKKKDNVPSFFTDLETLESEEEKENLHFTFEDEDDVRRAVVYSEIINKKEY